MWASSITLLFCMSNGIGQFTHKLNIYTNVVSLNPAQARCTPYNIMWYNLWVACGRSVVFSGTLVSSTNKTDHHDIAEILLKVMLNTITLTHIYLFFRMSSALPQRSLQLPHSPWLMLYQSQCPQTIFPNQLRWSQNLKIMVQGRCHQMYKKKFQKMALIGKVNKMELSTIYLWYLAVVSRCFFSIEQLMSVWSYLIFFSSCSLLILSSWQHYRI